MGIQEDEAHFVMLAPVATLSERAPRPRSRDWHRVAATGGLSIAKRASLLTLEVSDLRSFGQPTLNPSIPMRQ